MFFFIFGLLATKYEEVKMFPVQNVHKQWDEMFSLNAAKTQTIGMFSFILWSDVA